MKRLLVPSSVFFLLVSQAVLADPYLSYETVVDINDYKGTTYLSLMQKQIKPALDAYATEGFQVADGKTAVAALESVDGKVSWKVLKGLKGANEAEKKKNLKSIADTLSKEGAITFYDLPAAIAKTGLAVDRYGLTTYLALVSGGGVAVKINEENYAYNVNYGTGKTAKDEMTGRSFGESQPGHLAGDASDAAYLKALEAYSRSAGDKSGDFYRSILQILTNNDTSGYEKISADGQGVAADFLSVYTAEQDRHLMANLKTHAWDEALLEVTLLSAFHGGQKTVKVMFRDQLVPTTLKQAPGGTADEDRPKQKASMVDYWQFSSNPDPQSKNRSGINVTRKQFRALGAKITAYEKKNNPELVKKVQAHLAGVKPSGNLFADLSTFLINYKTPSKLSDAKFAADYTEFLMQVRDDADKITGSVVEGLL